MELLDIGAGILESNLAPEDIRSIRLEIQRQTSNLHLEQTLLLSLDTFEHRRVRKLELVVLGSLESVVRLGLRNVFNKALKVTAVAAKLEAVKMENVGDGVIKECTVVRDND